MPNVQNTISSHNKRLLKKEADIQNTEVNTRECNCKSKTDCPLTGKCQTAGIVYQATVTNNINNTEETYVGLSANTFKTRYTSHTCSFRNERKKHETTLSLHIWKLKNSNIPYSIAWKILAKRNPYSNTNKRCNLCLHEKFLIIFRPDLSSLNKRNELITTCRHRKKFLLCNST